MTRVVENELDEANPDRGCDMDHYFFQMLNWAKQMNPDNPYQFLDWIVKVLNVFVLFIGFWLTSIQLYLNRKQLKISAQNAELSLKESKASEEWRKTEFVAKICGDFFDDEENIRVLKVLDWKKRTIDFVVKGKRTTVTVTRELMMVALRDDSINKDEPLSFSSEQAAIRDAFDNFFSEFGYMYHHVQAGLVSKGQLDPYFSYWMDLLHGKKDHMAQGPLRTIWDYLEVYKFDSAIEFLKLYGDRPNFSRVGGEE